MRLITLLLLLSSCSLFIEDEYMNPELKTYYDQFMIESEKRGMNLKSHDYLLMDFDNLEGETKGICYTYKEGTYKIYIDYDFFTSGDPLKVEKVIFHELGHALLRRDHTTYPSIMRNAEINYNLKTRESYIDELFLVGKYFKNKSK